MKGKILVLFLALAVILLAAPYVGSVMAGGGQEKLSIEFAVGTKVNESYDRMWNTPQSVKLPDFGRILHTRGGDWGTGHQGFEIVVDEAGSNVVFDNEDIVYSCSYNCETHNMLYGQAAAPYLVIQMHVSETWIINNGEYSGQIEIKTSETLIYDFSDGSQSIEGSFVGHGVINGHNIKVSGVVELGGVFVLREGTVMGWP